jgi:hypothetical protein
LVMSAAPYPYSKLDIGENHVNNIRKGCSSTA